MIQNNLQQFPEDNFEKSEENITSDFSKDVPIFNNSIEEYIKVKKQKKEIRKVAAITGIPFLMLILFSLLWKLGLVFVTDKLGISRETVASYLSELSIRNVIAALFSSFVFIVFFALILKIFRKRVSDVVALERPKKGSILPLLLIGFGFCMFANLLNLFMENFFETLGTDYSMGADPVENTWLIFITTVVATAIVPALVEEFACRGIVLGVLLPYGEGFAILSSAIVFGIMHGNFEQMPFAFLVGLVLGFVRIKSGSLWICILIHFLNNMFSVISQYADLNLSTFTSELLYIIFLIIALGLGMLGAFGFLKTNDALALDSGSSGMKESNKYKWFFTSPIMIIAMFLYFLVSFDYLV